MEDLRLDNQFTLEEAMKVIKDLCMWLVKKPEHSVRLGTQIFIGPNGIGKREIVRQTMKELANSMNKPYIDESMLLSDNELLKKVINSKDEYFVFLRFDLTDLDFPFDFDLYLLKSNLEKEDLNLQNDYKPSKINLFEIDGGNKILALSALTRHPGVLFLDKVLEIDIQKNKLINFIHELAIRRLMSFGSSQVIGKLHNGVVTILAGQEDIELRHIQSQILTRLINCCGIREILL